MRILNWINASTLCSVVFSTFAYAQQLPPVGPAPENCPPGGCPKGDPEWHSYRFDNSRTGAQPIASGLSDPANVIANLSVEWSFTASPASAFKASPIVVNDTVFIGNDNGYFYALAAVGGDLIWQYPKAGDKPLLGGDTQWIYGIQSSAAYSDRPPNGAVIFAAQDPSLGPFCPQANPNCPQGSSYGSARLFALDAKLGTVIWKSDPIAEINGDCTNTDPHTGCQTKNTELHQRMGYSPPLVFDDKVYVGVQSFENPIQIGRTIAVDLATGHIVPTFQFQAVGTPASPLGTVRGGGVWNAPATDGTGIYFTTGNTNIDHGNPPQATEPNPNHGLSMIRVDKDTGNIIWAFQPVPFALDYDPDWAAGATVMSTSCGELIASVQKDGYSYAVKPGNGVPGPPSVLWQFPPTGYPFKPSGTPFVDTNGFLHGDNDYRRPGAAWNDVFIVRTGGESLVHDNVGPGYDRLHALNACATTEKNRVRWIADFSGVSSGGTGSLGAPTVTGGIVFVGTDHGYLVALADPSIWPPIGFTCSNIDYTTQFRCKTAGYAWVPIPARLAAVPGFGNLVAIRNEPVLAKGRVFVGTSKGDVYMLDAIPSTPICTRCGTPKQCCICNGGTWMGGRCS